MSATSYLFWRVCFLESCLSVDILLEAMFIDRLSRPEWKLSLVAAVVSSLVVSSYRFQLCYLAILNLTAVVLYRYTR